MTFLWGDWWEFLDEGSGRSYYFNEATQESVWVKPEEPVKQQEKPKPVVEEIPKVEIQKVEVKKKEEPKRQTEESTKEQSPFKRPISNSILEKQNSFKELLEKQQQMSNQQQKTMISPKGTQSQNESKFKVSQAILDRQKSIHATTSPYKPPIQKTYGGVNTGVKRVEENKVEKQVNSSPEKTSDDSGRNRVAKLSILLQNTGPFGMPGGKPPSLKKIFFFFF